MSLSHRVFQMTLKLTCSPLIIYTQSPFPSHTCSQKLNFKGIACQKKERKFCHCLLLGSLSCCSDPRLLSFLSEIHKIKCYAVWLSNKNVWWFLLSNSKKHQKIVYSNHLCIPNLLKSYNGFVWEIVWNWRYFTDNFPLHQSSQITFSNA